MASAPNDDLGLTTSISQTGSASPQGQLITGSQAHSGLYQSESGDNMTHVPSESRLVRVVLYSATAAESEPRFWIDPQVTFGSVARALTEMHPSQELVVLQANWGPRPYWAESHPDSPIGSTCQVLYAILKDQAKPYTMGVVRTSLSDYPIPIYTPEPECSTTLLGAVIASHPKLAGLIKSIVPYVDDHDIQNIPYNDDFVASHQSPASPVFINTLDEPPRELMVGSLYESFSPSSPKVSTPSDSDGLIPPLLQISFVECKLLVQRAYELDVFPLQMIHLSRALLHVIISLARGLTPAFGEDISTIGAALNADDDLADLLRVAPILLRQLERLLDGASAIMEKLASGSFNREEAQGAIGDIFFKLCGDLPGAVTVRHSEKVFKKLGSIDREELDTLELEGMKTTYPETITEDRKVANSEPMIDPDQGSGFGDSPAAGPRLPGPSDAEGDNIFTQTRGQVLRRGQLLPATSPHDPASIEPFSAGRIQQSQAYQYGDTNVFTPSDLSPSVPMYPSVLLQGQFPDPSLSPPLLEARLPSAPRSANDSRNSIQRFGHRTVHQSERIDDFRQGYYNRSLLVNMTSSPSATGPASTYSDTNAFTPGDLFPSLPMYPSVLARSFPDSRRTISSPPLPSTRLPPVSGRSTHDTRNPIQRFGHLTVHQSDLSTLKELIALHSAELNSLYGQLREADRLLADAEQRAVFVEGEASRGALDKGGLEVLSAQAIRESVLQGRQGIQDRITQLKRLRETHRGLLHPIRRIPMELLMMIMQFAVTQEEFDRRMAIFVPDHRSLSRARFSPSVRINSIDEASNPNESPSTRHQLTQILPMAILLSHVCSYWRTTAHKTPDLWWNIHFRLTEHSSVGFYSWSMARWFMEKARYDPTTTETPSRNVGMRLVFTGWSEHDHPHANDTLRKLLRMLADNEGGKPPFYTSAEGPTHSRRYSDIELSLTPDSETEDAPSGENTITLNTLMLGGRPPVTGRAFRIARLEIDFRELCEHEVLPGQSRNSLLQWFSGFPKPEEVVFIAHDSVYRICPHGDGPKTGFLSPPYGNTLIPCAKQVTLCNLSFEWAITSGFDDPYSNLTSLKLIYTCHFDSLLVKPKSMDNVGFLQFLRVAHNLVDLEIRLPSPLPVLPTSAVETEAPSTPRPSTTTTASSNGMSIPTSLRRLIISLPDFCRIIPLFLPESSRPSVVTIQLPSLHHLCILPHNIRESSESSLVAGDAQLIREFLQLTGANITHLEFLHRGGSEYPAYDLISSILPTASARDQINLNGQIRFLLRQFDRCQTLEVRGNENVMGLISIFGLKQAADPSSIAVVLGSDVSSALPASAWTSSSSRPVESAAASKVQSEALRHPSSSSVPQSTVPDSRLAHTPRTTRTNSPNKLSESPKGSPSTTPNKRTSLLSTPKEIIARVLSPVYKRKSLAIVETPVGTPKLVIDDLPAELVPDFRDLHSDPTRPVPPNSSMRSSGLHVQGDSKVHSSRVASSSRVDAVSAVTSGDRSSAPGPSVGQDNHSTETLDNAAVFPSVKRIIVHDGISFTASMAKTLADRMIEVVVHG